MNFNLNKYKSILQKLFIPDSHDIVGLDLNSDYIKVLKINSAVTPNKVENLAVVPMPENAMVKDQLKDLPLIAKKLKEIFNKNNVASNNVAMAIPRSWTITKNITVNAHMTMDEIESRVWIEASRHFSNLIGEIYLDFSVIGPSEQQASELELMLVASRKDQINPYLEVMRMADLNVKIVDVNCYALERALSLTAKSSLQSKTVALLNLDYMLMSLLVLDDGHLIYANDQAYEGHHLLSFNQEKALSSTAVDDVEGGKITEDKAMQVGFISYLRHMMQFFYSSRPNIKINQILLAGDCATLPNLIRFIQEEIGVETQLLNPFQNMSIGSGIDADQLKKEASALTLCCGLALSELK